MVYLSLRISVWCLRSTRPISSKLNLNGPHWSPIQVFPLFSSADYQLLLSLTTDGAPLALTEPCFLPLRQTAVLSSTLLSHMAPHTFLTLPVQCSLQNASRSVYYGKEGKNAFLLVSQVREHRGNTACPQASSRITLILQFFLMFFYRPPIFLPPQFYDTKPKRSRPESKTDPRVNVKTLLL